MVNLDCEVLQMFHELRMMLQLGIQVPDAGQELLSHGKKCLNYFDELTCIVAVSAYLPLKGRDRLCV
jgi:hypothetical protein